MEARRWVLFVVIAVSGAVRGQSPAPSAFEAASIKPSIPGRAGGGLNLFPNRIRIVNASLKFCVQLAWNVKDFQVSGGAGWTDNVRYDIEAAAAGPFKQGEYRTMLQALLANRFALVTHRETQEKNGYVLVAGRNGPKLPPPADDSDIMFGRAPSGAVALKAKNASMNQLAVALSTALGVTVVDRTGIEGQFDVSLQYTPEPGSQPLTTKSGAPMPPPSPEAAAGPTVFEALQERLGLKLEARKVPVEVIVIDQAAKPTEN